MKLNTRNVVWGVLGILFALGSLWIHYQIKVEIPRDESIDLGQLQVENEAPDFSASRVGEERPASGSAAS